MNPNSEKPNFLDKGTILAIVLVLIVWIGWARYMEMMYPKPPPTPEGTQTEVAAGTTSQTPVSTASPTANAQAVAPQSAPVAVPAPILAFGPEKTIAFESANWSFEISSRGMGLKKIQLKNYQKRDKTAVFLADVKEPYSFATGLASTGQPLDFVIEKTGEDSFVGRANANGVQVEKTFKIDSQNYTIDTVVKVSGPEATKLGLVTFLSDVLHDHPKGSFLSPPSTYDWDGWFVRHEGTKTRTFIDKEVASETSASNVSVASLNTLYFAQAIVDRSELFPRFVSQIPAKSPVAVGRLIYQPVNLSNEFTTKYVAFAGPKSFDLLAEIDPGLAEAVDYGMFAVIAKPILWLLKYLFALMNNWGWAIVVLTIIVRMIVLPLSMFSYRSMKAMQKIQPEMNRIREKYKDKPTEQRMQMNQEIMDLMKRNKANPIGGCLPMLLQLPVFLALYQVLGQSIELYQVPFIFWITDLSAKDHFYVLPVLMGITMYIQQKITPTTMDPQQAKILAWMPVIFSFFMLTLPSGLTLYIFVSTLFGIVQQWYFMRDNSSVQTVKEAKA